MSGASLNQSVAESIDAVARFAGSSPIAAAIARPGCPSAALWRHSPKQRRFHGSKQHILAISLRGDSRLEKLVEGRAVWSGVAPGSIVLLEAGADSDWLVDGSFEMLQLYLDDTGLPADGRLDRVDLPFRDPVLLQIAQAAALAMRDRDSDGRYLAPLLEGLRQCFVERYFRRLPVSGTALGGGLSGYAQRKIEAHIRDHLASRLDAKVLAEVAGMSVGHLNRAFRLSYGVSPHQYVLDQRTARAAIYLRDSDRDVASIAAMAGFGSASHLGVQFKRRWGVTPSRYRVDLPTK